MIAHHFDVIVIGAGILGTFHAYHAAKTGRKVLLLERDDAPREATIRNFGQAVPSGQAIPTWRNFGIEALRYYKELQALGDIGLRNNGSLYVASDEDELQLLHELADHPSSQDYACLPFTVQQCLDKAPALRADYIAGGLFFPGDCSLNPRETVHRILALLVQHFGVDYRPSQAVIMIDPSTDKATVQTAHGERFTAAKVYLCAGHEFKLLLPELFASSGMQVSKLLMMRTRPLPALSLPCNILTGLTIRRYEAFEACPSHKGITQVPKNQELFDWGIHILFKQEPDGRIIIGDSHQYAPAATPHSLGPDVEQHVIGLMLEEARRIVPLPSDALEATWAGYYATHPDGIFEHTLGNTVHIATGIGGKGMSTGAGYAADHIARTLTT